MVTTSTVDCFIVTVTARDFLFSVCNYYSAVREFFSYFISSACSRMTNAIDKGAMTSSSGVLYGD